VNYMRYRTRLQEYWSHLNHILQYALREAQESHGLDIASALQYLQSIGCEGQDSGEEGVQHTHRTVLQSDNPQLLLGEGQYLADQIEYIMRPYEGTGTGTEREGRRGEERRGEKRRGEEKESQYVAAWNVQL
jgi:hypothetical protein